MNLIKRLKNQYFINEIYYVKLKISFNNFKFNI